MHRRACELRQVIGVEFDAVDAADAASWPEQVGLAVVIHEYLGVEAAVPPLLHRACVLESAEVLEGSEGIVGHIEVVGVAREIELAPVFDDVRSYRDALHIVELPVQQVVRHPGAAARAVHIVFAAFLEDGDVAGGIASLPHRHRKRIAVAGLGQPSRRAEQQCCRQNEILAHSRGYLNSRSL